MSGGRLVTSPGVPAPAGGEQPVCVAASRPTDAHRPFANLKSSGVVHAGVDHLAPPNRPTRRETGVSEPTVEVLEDVSADDAAALARLLPQVSSRGNGLTPSRIAEVLGNPSTHVLVVRVDGRVTGMGLLVVCTTLTGQFGIIEEVAVDEQLRGRRLGSLLTSGLLNLASALRLDFVQLTSRPSREAANRLYQRMGFQLRETNCYRHALDSIPSA
jgi:ribosomal protein S18 acetylase RimI-like enzyme